VPISALHIIACAAKARVAPVLSSSLTFNYLVVVPSWIISYDRCRVEICDVLWIIN